MKTLLGIPRPSPLPRIRHDVIEQMRTNLQDTPHACISRMAGHFRACGCSRRTTLNLSLEVNKGLPQPIWVQEVLRIVTSLFAAVS